MTLSKAQASSTAAFVLVWPLQEIPHTATGKVSKLTLRQMFTGYTPTRQRSKL